MKISKERKECVLCLHDNLLDHRVFTFFPVYVGTSKKHKHEHLLSHMHWGQCERCGEIQLKKLIEEDVLYAKPHNPAVGKNWAQHNKAFVNFINNECYGSVLEIGGGNLHIANMLASSEKVNQYSVIDSNIFKSNDQTGKIKFNEEIFDLSSIEDKKYDFVIHSHVLEHFYQPLKSLKEIRRILKPNGKMIFSAPMIDNMLKEGFTNALNFEHTYYINEDVVKFMLEKTGFSLDKSLFYSTPSLKKWCLFTSCSIGEVKQIDMQWNNKPAKDFRQFLKSNKDVVASINKRLEEYEDSEKFVFGGHIFTQFLLNFGLKDDFICVLDNDKDKHNEFLYGTSLIVRSPKILSKYKKPVVVLKAGLYNEEIKQDILKNINDETIFLE